MTLRTSISVFRATFFATLGLTPLVACSSSNSSNAGNSSDAGSGGAATGGSHAGGSGGAAAGGSHSGGAGGSTGGKGGGGATATGGTDGGLDASTDAGSSSCKNPKPELGADGKPTGYVDCDGGWSHRAEKRACASLLPRATPCGTGPVGDAAIAGGECNVDADCKASANGYCAGGGALLGCFCNYGCKTDADCPAGNICGCTTPVGVCVPTANCTVDADCGKGLLCMSSLDESGCRPTYACQTANDTCVTSADCTTDANLTPNCEFITDHHECGTGHPCQTGRPFLIGGAARVARLVNDDKWASGLCPALDGIEDAVRAELGARWTEIALMEHASIAAFARFSLELISLGAPPELVMEAQVAMADETVHARDAFALAGAYAGRSRGPGRLDVDRALSEGSPLSIFRTAVLEGCIGETVAAVEAAEALAHATDPAVVAALSRVAPDEKRHADLAWRFVQWMLEEGPGELRASAAREILLLVESEAANMAPREPEVRREEQGMLLAHGVLGQVTRRELRRRVMMDVIVPCARALVSATRRHRDAPHAAAAA